MDSGHLTELIELEDTYWWHIAKRRLVASLLKKHFPPAGRVVEGGIGSSRNLLEFRKAGYDVHGFDLMQEAVDNAHSRDLGAEVHDLAEPWPIDDASCRAVVLLDVIEHLEHPVQVLEHARRALTDDGGLVVTVPSYPWLFGDWDRRLGHFRRYTNRMFYQHAEAAGLRVRWLQHWNAFSLPPAVAVRGYQRVFPKDRPPEFPRVSPLMNQTLLTLAGMERWCLSKRMPVPFGLSLAGVLTK
ncbi:MAG: class I SAM-dependent methyltransferase [Pirellulaceae bacterium]|jgi:SAM-dependent methyltransferase|nr:class I SAM-dependent methyltransferase [Pirellulaceae bacterium]MDP7017963.1 class I SAM-dependent methyltransferase [Pirellulaceae bacterium]